MFKLILIPFSFFLVWFALCMCMHTKSYGGENKFILCINKIDSNNTFGALMHIYFAISFNSIEALTHFNMHWWNKWSYDWSKKEKKTLSFQTTIYVFDEKFILITYDFVTVISHTHIHKHTQVKLSTKCPYTLCWCDFGLKNVNKAGSVVIWIFYHYLILMI